MRFKAWLKYLILMSLILLIQFLGPAIYQNEFEKFVFPIKDYVILSFVYLSIGILLGADQLISSLKNKGKWKLNLPKLLFIGIPSLYFSACYYLFSMYYGRKYFLFIKPVINFLTYNRIFISVFQVMLGYSIVTAFYKQDEEDRSYKAKPWIKYLAYSFIILVIQFCAVEVYAYTQLKAHLLEIESIALYGGLGFIVGTEYLAAEAKKAGRWKISLPKIILMGIPSLYISLNFSLLSIDNQLIRDSITYPVQFLAGSFKLDYHSILEYYVPVFQFILGYSVITSFYKFKGGTVTNYRIDNALKHIEKVLIPIVLVFAVVFIMLKLRSTIAVPDSKNIASMEIVTPGAGSLGRDELFFDMNVKEQKDTADNIYKWLKSGRIEGNAEGELQPGSGSPAILAITFEDGSSVKITSAVGSTVTETPDGGIEIRGKRIDGQVTANFEHGGPIRLMAPELKDFLESGWVKLFNYNYGLRMP